ncbi:unnamed protein product [Closterium sp. NIES-54]
MFVFAPCSSLPHRLGGAQGWGAKRWVGNRELHTWQRQLAACGSSFELQEPLLSCRGAYLRASGQHAALPLHLLEAASLCRKARLLSQAAVHLQHLKDACRALTPTGHVPTAVPSPSPTGSGAAALAEEGAWAVVGVSFCGRVEEAKLLALEGRQDMAVRLLQHLLRPDLPLHASQGSPSPAATSAAAAASAASAASTAAAAACVPVPDRVYTLGLAAKWLGETRSISSRVVLSDYLWRAVDLTTHSPPASPSAAAAASPPSYASFPFANNWHQQQQERQWKEQQQQGGCGRQQGGEGEQAGQGEGQGQWEQRRQRGERKELEEMTKRLKASRREDERRVYGMKIMELQKQLSMDDREANDLQEDERRVYGMKIMELQKQLSMDDREANDLQVRPSPLPLFPLPTRSLTYDF